MFTLLNSPGSYKDMRILQELSSSDREIICRYNLFCALLFRYTNMKEIVDKEIIIKIGSKWNDSSIDPFEVEQGDYSLNDILVNKNFSLIILFQEVAAIIEQSPKMKKFVYILPEYLITLHMNYHFSYNIEIYETRFKFVLNQFYQSGIAQWLDRMKRWEILLKILFKEKIYVPPFKVLTLNDLAIGFIIVPTGCFIATCVFILEIIFKKKRKANRFLFLI